MMESIIKSIDNVGNLVGGFVTRTIKVVKDPKGSVKAVNKWFVCQVLGKGCFVKDTPVLIVSNRSGQQDQDEVILNGFIDCEQSHNWLDKDNCLKNKAYGLALAVLPIITPVLIQDVHLLDYALAHISVNSPYTLTANNDDTYIIGKVPYTSDQQRLRDQYDIKDTDWNEVTFEQVLGPSKCKLALQNDWINQNNYAANVIVNMNLPEQGISGPFRITSINHIMPQKKPVDENDVDDYEYRLVTGLFVHESNDVWNITFDDGEVLGVTNNHPIYSVSKGDWQHAGHLEIGEEVLAKDGNTKVVSKDRDYTMQTVYNLEVKDLHNFLVGNLGIVVHNNCWKNLDELLEKSDEVIKEKIAQVWNIGEDFGGAKEDRGRGLFFEALCWKKKYKGDGFTFTGVDDLGEGLQNQFHPIDFFKGSKAVSMKTSKVPPNIWKNYPSNKDHIRNMCNNLNTGTFGNVGGITHVDLDIYVPTNHNNSAAEWQKMVDDLIDELEADPNLAGNYAHLKGKIKVNLSTIEEVIEKKK